MKSLLFTFLMLVTSVAAHAQLNIISNNATAYDSLGNVASKKCIMALPGQILFMQGVKYAGNGYEALYTDNFLMAGDPKKYKGYRLLTPCEAVVGKYLEVEKVYA